jgi:acyl-CoA thioester hydrolase
MKIELPAVKKRVFQMVLPIRWGDMDAMGHVNNVSYFCYMEACRIDWFESDGIRVEPDGIGPVIVNAFCNYYQEFTYPGNILMTLYTSDPGRTTFETWVTMEDATQPGVVKAEGGATTIWVNSRLKKAVELPAHIRQLVTP